MLAAGAVDAAAGVVGDVVEDVGDAVVLAFARLDHAKADVWGKGPCIFHNRQGEIRRRLVGAPGADQENGRSFCALVGRGG